MELTNIPSPRYSLVKFLSQGYAKLKRLSLPIRITSALPISRHYTSVVSEQRATSTARSAKNRADQANVVAMPPGATERIAQRLGMPTEAVRAVFAAEHDHHDLDPRAAIHMERSPHGAYILIQDNAVLQAAREMVGHGAGWTGDGQIPHDNPDGPRCLHLAIRGVITAESVRAARETLRAATRQGKAIVLTISSPGGTAEGVPHLARALRESGRFAAAIIDGQCHSAAFWIATQAQRIIALQPEATAGSVGVCLRYVDPDPALRRAGLTVQDLYSDLTPRKNRAMRLAAQGDYSALRQEVLNPLARRFIDDVRAGRGNRLPAPEPPALEAILQGGHAAARELLALGLIDEICEDPALLPARLRAGCDAHAENRPTMHTTTPQAQIMALALDAPAAALPTADDTPAPGAAEPAAPGAGPTHPDLRALACGMDALEARIAALSDRVEALRARLAAMGPQPRGERGDAPPAPAPEPTPTGGPHGAPDARAAIRARLRAAEAAR